MCKLCNNSNDDAFLLTKKSLPFYNAAIDYIDEKPCRQSYFGYCKKKNKQKFIKDESIFIDKYITNRLIYIYTGAKVSGMDSVSAENILTHKNHIPCESIQPISLERVENHLCREPKYEKKPICEKPKKDKKHFWHKKNIYPKKPKKNVAMVKIKNNIGIYENIDLNTNRIISYEIRFKRANSKFIRKISNSLDEAIKIRNELNLKYPSRIIKRTKQEKLIRQKKFHMNSNKFIGKYTVEKNIYVYFNHKNNVSRYTYSKKTKKTGKISKSFENLEDARKFKQRIENEQ